MIASPQPTTWWHRAVVALVPALALFTYTTAQADGEAEAKSQAKPEADAPKSAEAGGVRDGDQGNKRGPRDGEVRKEGPRDGEAKRTGPRDGEGKKSGPRDGEVRKEGAKDGDGAKREGGEVQDGKVKLQDGDGRRVDLRVGILPGGSFTADGHPVSEEALLEKLKVQAANGMDQVVVLQASETTEYKHIMKALELCSQAKVTNVAFNTGKAGDGGRKGSR